MELTASAFTLAERGNFTDKRNLGSDEGGGGFAHQFSRGLTGDDNRNSAHDERVKNVLSTWIASFDVDPRINRWRARIRSPRQRSHQ